MEIYMDGYLKNNLDILKKNIVRDWDFWILVDGLERTGKSTFAGQIAKYLDPGLSITRIVFTPEQFDAAVENSKKYQAVVWDEAVTGAISTDMTKMARVLQKKAVQIGQKNLFVILVMHSYFEMKKYFAVHRSWFLLHTYFKSLDDTKIFQRGYFEFYDFKKKKKMYVNDKTRRNYHYSEKPNFRGRFSKQYGVPEEDYLEKKANIESGETTSITEKEWLELCFRKGMKVSEIKDYSSYHPKSLYRVKLQVTL